MRQKNQNEGRGESGGSKTRPGPKPDHVQIDGDWEDAVKKALGKKSEPKEQDEDGGKADPERHCVHCGAHLLHGDHFCPKCGRMIRPG